MEKRRASADFVAVHKGSYYDSDFESDDNCRGEEEGDDDGKRSRKRKYEDDELVVSLYPSSSSSKKKRKKEKKKDRKGLGKKAEVEQEFCKEQSRTQRFHIVSMDAYSRHKKFINDYMLYYRGSRADYKRDTSKDKTDLDVIRENHKFLWDEQEEDLSSWEKRLSKKYYDKLFKEYCIADLSRYKENKVAFRWQMEKEVISGKGQFVCANKVCGETEGLRSWEVNFGYVEEGQKKNALVKVRLCPDCSYRLNYHHQRKEVTKMKKKKKKGSYTKKDDSLNIKKVSTSRKKHRNDSSEEEEEIKNDSQVVANADDDYSVWTKKPEAMLEKSRDEEFDEYFEDMFL